MHPMINFIMPGQPVKAWSIGFFDCQNIRNQTVPFVEIKNRLKKAMAINGFGMAGPTRRWSMELSLIAMEKIFLNLVLGNCAVTIKKEEGETIVELVQDNIPTDEQGMHYWHLGCKTGWTFYLANMKSLYEGGIDLRNRNEKLQEVINS